MTYELMPVGKNYDMVIFDGDIVQGTWALVINAAQFLNCYYANSTNADDDEFIVPLVLGKGTYDVHLVYVESSNRAKMDVSVDGNVIINQLDMYAAATAYNIIHEESNVAIGGGVHMLSFKANGKNAASSGYTCALSHISFRKVA